MCLKNGKAHYFPIFYILPNNIVIMKHLFLFLATLPLLAQKKIKPELKLITNQELIAIQVIWNRDLVFDYSVKKIYNSRFMMKMGSLNLIIFNTPIH